MQLYIYIKELSPRVRLQSMVWHEQHMPTWQQKPRGGEVLVVFWGQHTTKGTRGHFLWMVENKEGYAIPKFLKALL